MNYLVEFPGLDLKSRLFHSNTLKPNVSRNRMVFNFTATDVSDLSWPVDLCAGCKDKGGVPEVQLSPMFYDAKKDEIAESLAKFAPVFFLLNLG